MPDTSLDELGLKYNCDKASLDRSKSEDEAKRPGHDYLRKYEFFLDRFRDRTGVRFLELGIGPDWNMGASLKIWNDFFQQPDFSIKMVDINPKAAAFAGGRVTVEIGDLGDTAFLGSLADDAGYDIILDDASHFWGHQIHGFLNLYSSVKPGGVYIIEDIHTSFGALRQQYANGETTDCFAFLTALSAMVAGGRRDHPVLENINDRAALRDFAAEIDSVTFIQHSCIICKSRYY